MYNIMYVYRTYRALQCPREPKVANEGASSYDTYQPRGLGPLFRAQVPIFAEERPPPSPVVVPIRYVKLLRTVQYYAV
jgi:hypothetical protein